jgi:hypothetical protein
MAFNNNPMRPAPPSLVFINAKLGATYGAGGKRVEGVGGFISHESWIESINLLASQ